MQGCNLAVARTHLEVSKIDRTRRPPIEGYAGAIRRFGMLEEKQEQQLAQRWQERFGTQPLLQGLLEGDALPSKNNLRTRLFKRADRDSDYTYLANPISPPAAARQVA